MKRKETESEQVVLIDIVALNWTQSKTIELRLSVYIWARCTKKCMSSHEMKKREWRKKTLRLGVEPSFRA